MYPNYSTLHFTIAWWRLEKNKIRNFTKFTFKSWENYAENIKMHFILCTNLSSLKLQFQSPFNWWNIVATIVKISLKYEFFIFSKQVKKCHHSNKRIFINCTRIIKYKQHFKYLLRFNNLFRNLEEMNWYWIEAKSSSRTFYCTNIFFVFFFLFYIFVMMTRRKWFKGR